MRGNLRLEGRGGGYMSYEEEEAGGHRPSPKETYYRGKRDLLTDARQPEAGGHRPSPKP
jgi:hypothetical protein